MRTSAACLEAKSPQVHSQTKHVSPKMAMKQVKPLRDMENENGTWTWWCLSSGNGDSVVNGISPSSAEFPSPLNTWRYFYFQGSRKGGCKKYLSFYGFLCSLLNWFGNLPLIQGEYAEFSTDSRSYYWNSQDIILYFGWPTSYSRTNLEGVMLNSCVVPEYRKGNKSFTDRRTVTGTPVELVPNWALTGNQ